jgi:hypothetical protein
VKGWQFARPGSSAAGCASISSTTTEPRGLSITWRSESALFWVTTHSPPGLTCRTYSKFTAGSVDPRRVALRRPPDLRRESALVHVHLRSECEVLRPELPDEPPLVAPRICFLDGQANATGVGGPEDGAVVVR